MSSGENWDISEDGSTASVEITVSPVGAEFEEPVSEHDHRRLMAVANSDMLVAYFGGFIAGKILEDELNGDLPQRQETPDEKLRRCIDTASYLGAHWALSFRSCITATEWPEGHTPEAFYAFALEDWLEQESAESNATYDGLGIREYVERLANG